MGSSNSSYSNELSYKVTNDTSDNLSGKSYRTANTCGASTPSQFSLRQLATMVTGKGHHLKIDWQQPDILPGALQARLRSQQRAEEFLKNKPVTPTIPQECEWWQNPPRLVPTVPRAPRGKPVIASGILNRMSNRQASHLDYDHIPDTLVQPTQGSNPWARVRRKVRVRPDPELRDLLELYHLLSREIPGMDSHPEPGGSVTEPVIHSPK